jgi:hypothetical protein
MKCMLFQTTVDEIAVVHTLTQDETIEAGESNSNTVDTIEHKPSGGVDNDEHSNSSSNDDRDGEDDGTAKSISDGELHTTTRSGRTSRLPSRYRTEIGDAAIMKHTMKSERNYYQSCWMKIRIMMTKMMKLLVLDPGLGVDSNPPENFML